MKILSTAWFTNSTGVTGIVVAENVETKEVKAYIGVAKGTNLKLETDRIVSWGSVISARRLFDILSLLIPPEGGTAPEGKRENDDSETGDGEEEGDADEAENQVSP